MRVQNKTLAKIIIENDMGLRGRYQIIESMQDFSFDSLNLDSVQVFINFANSKLVQPFNIYPKAFIAKHFYFNQIKEENKRYFTLSFNLNSADQNLIFFFFDCRDRETVNLSIFSHYTVLNCNFPGMFFKTSRDTKEKQALYYQEMEELSDNICSIFEKISISF